VPPADWTQRVAQSFLPSHSRWRRLLIFIGCWHRTVRTWSARWNENYASYRVLPVAGKEENQDADIHSCRSATIGSTHMAWRAGM
jgi:hypothetical protein